MNSYFYNQKFNLKNLTVILSLITFISRLIFRPKTQRPIEKLPPLKKRREHEDREYQFNY